MSDLIRWQTLGENPKGRCAKLCSKSDIAEIVKSFESDLIDWMQGVDVASEPPKGAR